MALPLCSEADFPEFSRLMAMVVVAAFLSGLHTEYGVLTIYIYSVGAKMGMAMGKGASINKAEGIGLEYSTLDLI